jgi:hypothetical protein
VWTFPWPSAHTQIGAAGQGLRVHPDNPSFLFYQGRFLVHWANNNHGAPLDVLQEHGFNHYEISIRWIDGLGEPLEGHRFPEEGNIRFNGAFFSDLASEIEAAGKRDIAVTIVLYGGPHFEGDRTAGSRFGRNPWNACLGGPIDIGSCPYQTSGEKSSGGLKQFLTLEHYDYTQPLTQAFEAYDPTWDTPRKVQYRQEEILEQFMRSLGHLDNWAFNVMWEIGDQWGGDWDKAKQWGNWFAGYVHHNFDPARLVMTGEEGPNEVLMERYGVPHYASVMPEIDGSQHEAIASWGLGPYGNLEALGSDRNGKPKVIVGYDPWNSEGEITDHLCAGGAGDVSAERVVNYMRAALLTEMGVHPSTPFHIENCGGGKEEILDYVAVLQRYLATVDDWSNEPGDEIREATLPTFENYRTFDPAANDLPDGEGRKGWPRWGEAPPPRAFEDVPSTHWAYEYVDLLAQEGYIAGCSEDPPRYCPERAMTRAEGAVFVERGLRGEAFEPPAPEEATFADVSLDAWFAKWVEALWSEGYTAGCGTQPLVFCPLQGHSRAEATVFFLRMLKGRDFLPQEAAKAIYGDVPVGAEAPWYSKWVYAARAEGILDGCDDPTRREEGAFRPEEELTRAEAACMMSRAKFPEVAFGE